MRLRRNHERLLLRHHPHGVDRGGQPPAEFRELYGLLQRAQAQAVAAATVGTTCEAVDGVARSVIAAGGYGDAFIHRTGHGIGLEEHEDPYIVAGNPVALVAGPRLLGGAGDLPERALRGPNRGHRGGDSTPVPDPSTPSPTT